MATSPPRRTRPRTRLSRRNASRRWCIPPAIEREPDEMLEASHVLDEIGGDVGLLLWQALRDITLWASVPAGKREGLFTPDAAGCRLRLLLSAAAEPAVEVSLTTLTSVVGDPAAADPEIVSLVCLQLSRWAEARGALATALGYAQAAALATPEDPGPAYAAGSLALRWRRSARSETWLRRAIGLARRAKDWNVYALAYVDLGALYARRGNAQAAERYYVQALRAARRHGLTPVRGAARHGLLLLALESGALDDAERHARDAARAYGRGHPRLPELEHDMAYLWVSRGSFARAVPMLHKLLPSRVEPVERSLTLAVLARAAAGAGDRRLYQEAWSDAWSIVVRKPGEEGKHARALLELARAAGQCRDWPHMEQAGRLALSVASGEAAIAAQVEELASTLHRRIH
ncbi:MAG TPA: hypothetical protein VF746_22780 [Longimicrobium sp.]